MMCQSSRDCANAIEDDEYEMLRIESQAGVVQDYIVVCLDCARAARAGDGR